MPTAWPSASTKSRTLPIGTRSPSAAQHTGEGDGELARPAVGHERFAHRAVQEAALERLLDDLGDAALLARTRSWSSRYFSTAPRVASTRALVELGATPNAASACRPVDRLGHARRLVQVPGAHRLHRAGHLAGERLETCGTRMRTMRTSRSNVGCSTQWYRQRRLSASCTSRVRLDVRITIGGRPC
jgi:hypothetical protein